DDRAAGAGDVDEISLEQRAALHVLRMHLQARLRCVAEEATQLAGAAHAVPLVAQASRGQAEGVAGVARLGYGLPGQGTETSAAIRSGELSVFIQPRQPCTRA